MICQLHSSQATPDYGELTFPRFRPLLDRTGEAEPFVAVGASIDDRPAALALARIDQNGSRSAELLSIAVASSHRRQGVGTAVLLTLEEILLRRGCRRLYAVYLGDSASRVALESTLKRTGWDIGRPRTIICRTDVPTMRPAPWIWTMRLSTPYEFFAWSELTANERRSLSQPAQELNFPPNLSPFVDEHSIEKNSVGLRYLGRVVGWQINHRVFADTIRYSRLFIKPELPQRAQGMAIVAESIRRHVTDPRLRDAPKGLFHLEADNMRMQRFVLRRLSPWIQSFTMSYEASKLPVPGTS